MLSLKVNRLEESVQGGACDLIFDTGAHDDARQKKYANRCIICFLNPASSALERASPCHWLPFVCESITPAKGLTTKATPPRLGADPD